MYEFVFIGDRFLWKMVRFIVNVLISVGTGIIDMREAQSILSSIEMPHTLRQPAPARGLFLERVWY